jgi:hypothetical protein
MPSVLIRISISDVCHYLNLINTPPSMRKGAKLITGLGVWNQPYVAMETTLHH